MAISQLTRNNDQLNMRNTTTPNIPVRVPQKRMSWVRRSRPCSWCQPNRDKLISVLHQIKGVYHAGTHINKNDKWFYSNKRRAIARVFGDDVKSLLAIEVTSCGATRTVRVAPPLAWWMAERHLPHFSAVPRLAQCRRAAPVTPACPLYALPALGLRQATASLTVSILHCVTVASNQ